MSLVNKLFSVGFVCWFALSQILLGMSSAYAQSGLIDVEPPLIEHNIVSAVDSAARQSFLATVVDDDELDSVSLYYRFQNDSDYSAVPMNRVSYSSTYIAHVATARTSDRNIEYYIQARDRAGNRTVRGYAFNPLVRIISVVEVAPIASTGESIEAVASSGSRPWLTALYVVLGVLTLGLLAGSVSGGDEQSVTPSTNEGNCPGGVCTISITVSQP